jgi:hypothetical protein
MDLLALKRQYANIDLFEQNTLSNASEDLSHLDRTPFSFDVFDQDQNDLDECKSSSIRSNNISSFFYR